MTYILISTKTRLYKQIKITKREKLPFIIIKLRSFKSHKVLRNKQEL